MDTDKHGWEEITGNILGSAMSVSNALGVGFLEKVYENAMMAELTLRGVKARQQQSLLVRYKGAVVGEYVADLIVEDRVLVELKHVKQLDPIHLAQCINYLKATGLRVCLLINFGKQTLEWKRVLND